MMTIWLYTGGRPSNGAKTLAALDGFGRCVKGGGIKVQDILINWGTTKIEIGLRELKRILNKPEKIYLASNKLKAFTVMSGADVRCVDWTEDQAVAQDWANTGSTVVVRKTLTGHSGAGIIIVEPGGDVPEVPLYTKYIFKIKEFRVHVCDGKVIDTQQKIRDPEQEPKDWKVRSHANGFIFARNLILDNEARNTLAIEAVKALGLDFGAVDIIQDKVGRYYVLEVNTAPGLEGQTIQSYEEAFRAA